MLKLSTTFVILILALSGCSSLSIFDKSKDEKQTEEKRISVLAHQARLSVDPSHNDITIVLPDMVENDNWSLQNTQLVFHHAISKSVDFNVSVETGSGLSDGLRLTSSPIISGGLIYTIDGTGNVEARFASDIEKLKWRVAIEQEERETSILDFIKGSSKQEFLGGNISYGNDALYITTAQGNVISLDARTGKKIWSRFVKIPIKSAPVVAGSSVFVITSENKLYALDANTGKTLWTHTGLTETTSVFGAPSVVVGDGIVIAPYSSGEIYAINAATGKVLWNSLLSSKRGNGLTSIITLSDIDATPIIHDGNVYVVSYDGIFTAFNLHSGKRIWVQEIPSTNTPWIAGDFLFIVTTENEILCLHAPTGRIKWIRRLPSHTKPFIRIWGTKDKKGEPIIWSRPILAGGSLFIASSAGKMAEISPYDGKKKRYIKIPKEVYIAPIVANKNIYVFNNEAELAGIVDINK